MTKRDAISTVLKKHFPDTKWEDFIILEDIIDRAYFRWSKAYSSINRYSISTTNILKSLRLHTSYSRIKFPKLLPRNLIIQICEEVEELYDGEKGDRFHKTGVKTLPIRRYADGSQETRMSESLISKELERPQQ